MGKWETAKVEMNETVGEMRGMGREKLHTQGISVRSSFHSSFRSYVDSQHGGDIIMHRLGD
jgi:hypothetical protein